MVTEFAPAQSLFRRRSDSAMRLPERVIDCDNDFGDLDRSEKGI
jgi:hypothetical protein